MIESPSESVQLTFEQMQQLDTYQKRLSNLDAEVFAASKNLQEIRRETESVTRENEYQTEIFNTLQQQVKVLEERKEVLDIAVSTAEAKVEEHGKKADDMRIALGEHSSKMASDSKELDERKLAHDQEWAAIANEKEQLGVDRKEVEAARQVLGNAAKSVPWRYVAE